MAPAPNARRGRVRSVVAPCIVLLSAMLIGRAAWAGVGVGIAPTYPPVMQVGQTNVAVGLTMTNTSTMPESGGTLTLSEIKHVPACGSAFPVPCPAGQEDPAVFLVKGPATGMAGTACGGFTFTISTPDPTTGEVEFTPNTPVILAPVGSGEMAMCTINFFVDVLSLPTHDGSGVPGIQTYQQGRVRAIASVNMVLGTGTGSGLITIVQPTPTPTSTATPTVTQTPLGPLGEPCEDGTQCESGFCIDGQCCNELCSPSQVCIDGICVELTPTPSPTPTTTSTATPTVTDTPTRTPGPDDCCECTNAAGTCAQPSDGQCNLQCPNGVPPVIMPDSVCIVGPPPTTTGTPSTPGMGGCATRTPTPSPTATATPKCLGDEGIPGLIPGYCGPLKVDCLSEICIFPPGPLRSNGLPDYQIACKDDDPTCDSSMGDKTCTFLFRICLNVQTQENRFACNAGGPITEVRLKNPRQGSPKPGIDTENRDAFEAALMKLGGIVSGVKKRSIAFNPPITDTICTELIPWKVQLRQNARTLVYSSRKFRVNYLVYQPVGRYDGDHLFLRCNP